jgi:alkylhydroperoxidase family enzyme
VPTPAVTWLPETAPGDTPLDRVFGLRPDLYEPFRAFYAVFWADHLLDPVVLELCRLRVAQLLGCDSEQRVRYAPARDAGLTEEQVAGLPTWPQAPSFTDAQRAALAFAEQFVLDPHGIDDELRDTVIDHLTLPGLVALCEALALFDGFCRFRIILGVEPPAALTVVAGPAPGAALT